MAASACSTLKAMRTFAPPALGKTTQRLAARQILFSGFGGRKGPSSMGKISIAGVLRLRATSAVSRDTSVRRSAQDDVFVGILKKNILNKLEPMGTASWARSRQIYPSSIFLLANGKYLKLSLTSGGWRRSNEGHARLTALAAEERSSFPLAHPFFEASLSFWFYPAQSSLPTSILGHDTPCPERVGRPTKSVT
jgi:hypothetical protein